MRRMPNDITTVGLLRGTSINVLPDDVLLEIFHSYLGKVQKIEAWQPLIHVCRRWRTIVLRSPHRLNLRLACTPKSLARNTLGIWPALPLVIKAHISSTSDVDNTIALLEHRDRVYKIDLDGSSAHLERVFAVMQEPFPELTDLLLLRSHRTALVLPDSFLGRSAPGLRDLQLDHISIPGLPKLLLSSAHLVHLHLCNIPYFASYSGYIPPEAIIACPSTLTGLESLWLKFQSPLSRPDMRSRRPPPVTRSILPSLTEFRFKGVSEYLEDFVARVDVPRLSSLRVTFFNQLIFDTPELVLLTRRTPKLNAFYRAAVHYNAHVACIEFASQALSDFVFLSFTISCRGPDWQLSCLAQICTSLLPHLSTDDLYIDSFREPWQDIIEGNQWLELLHPFTSVKHLHLKSNLAACISPALQELIGARTTEVLPILRYIFIQPPSEPLEEGIQQFVAARQLTNQPVTVLPWVARTEPLMVPRWVTKYD
jgi:hypothetical protein